MSEVSVRPIASETGILCVLALDHRDAMRNAFQRAGVANVTADVMLETKLRILEAVDTASGVLLDHLAAERRDWDGAGVLVPLEKQGHLTTGSGRVNALEFDASDACRVGADGCKLLLYYRADHGETTRRQLELVARAAEDCHAAGLPLVLEPLVYRVHGETEEAYKAAFADLVIAGAEELAGSGADLLKLQYPGDAKLCERLTRAAAPIPWALLGGRDVDGETFALELEIACRSGACGFLAGRTVWSGALRLRPEEQRMWLAEHAKPLFERLSGIAHAHGRSI